MPVPPEEQPSAELLPEATLLAGFFGSAVFFLPGFWEEPFLFSVSSPAAIAAHTLRSSGRVGVSVSTAREAHVLFAGEVTKNFVWSRI